MLAFASAPQQAPVDTPVVDRALNPQQDILQGLGNLDDRLHGV